MLPKPPSMERQQPMGGAIVMVMMLTTTCAALTACTYAGGLCDAYAAVNSDCSNGSAACARCHGQWRPVESHPIPNPQPLGALHS